MSSTNRGAQRDLDDHYATPPDLAALICRHIRDDWFAARGLRQPQTILEPGCGEGAFMEGAKAAWPDAFIFGVEKNPTLHAEATKRGHTVVLADYLQPLLEKESVELVLTNPPFVLAQEFIQHTIPLLAPGGYAGFLVRLNFLGGLARFRGLWRGNRHARHLYVLPARPSFTSDGKKDSIEYMVIMISAEPGPGHITLSFLDNTEIRNALRGDEVKTTYVPNPER